jgi:5-formyltetrahydrofolate cyclo-ligase
MKQELRKQMRALAGSAATDSSHARAALAEWLDHHPERRTIAVFSALPGEVDLSELTAGRPDRRWVYPKVRGEELSLHAIRDPEAELVPGAFGIREPRPDLTSIPLEMIDAFLCPGLAFDRRGGRLGRGKGFYDRLLENARTDALKIGVCFPWQIVDDTFAEPHDIAMDAVLF